MSVERLYYWHLQYIIIHFFLFRSMSNVFLLSATAEKIKILLAYQYHIPYQPYPIMPQSIPQAFPFWQKCNNKQYENEREKQRQRVRLIIITKVVEIFVCYAIHQNWIACLDARVNCERTYTLIILLLPSSRRKHTASILFLYTHP